MTQNLDDWENRLAELKGAFDEDFALPLVSSRHEKSEFILIEAGGQDYAIGIRDLSGLEICRMIVPVPTEKRGLLGVSGVQGQVIPVFDLAGILGAGPRKIPPRWIALHRDKELVGLAFDKFHGVRQITDPDRHDVAPATGQTHLSRQAIQVDSHLIHVVDIPSVVSSIRGTPKS